MISTGFFINGIDLHNVLNPFFDMNNTYIDDDLYQYYDAYVFQMGSCHLFAHALRYNYNYSIFKRVRHEDETIIHVYCKSRINDMSAFIDVRGITFDYLEFFRGYQTGTERPYRVSLENDLQENYARLGYSFALGLIENYDYYDVNLLKNRNE